MAKPSLSNLGGSVTGHSLFPLRLPASAYSPSKNASVIPMLLEKDKNVDENDGVKIC